MKVAGVFVLSLGALLAQVPNPTQQQPALTPNETGQPMPIFRVTVVSRTTKAVNYHHRTGIHSHRFSRHRADAGGARRSQRREPDGLHQDRNSPRPHDAASQFGPEYMTYVLWGITPEGRAVESGRSGAGRRSRQPALHHRSADVRPDRHRRAVFRGHAAERRGGGRKLHPQRHQPAPSSRWTPSTNCCSAASTC